MDLKHNIYRSFVRSKQIPINFCKTAVQSILQVLRTAYVDQQSTSLIVNGKNDEVLSILLQVQRVLLKECRRDWVVDGLGAAKSSTPLLARVTGNLNDSDGAGILSLADQFCFLGGRERNTNALLEDLTDFLAQCKLNGTPAIIVIEDFHLFAHSRRQTLVYTLLDLLHRSDLLFAVVGVTERLDTFSRLEKRVLSRMYSQAIVVPHPSVEEICAQLHWLLTAKAHDSEEPLSDDLLDYNRSVEQMVGQFVLRPVKIVSRQFVSEISDTKEMDEPVESVSGHKRALEETVESDALDAPLCTLEAKSAGSLVDLIEMQLRFGRSRKFFTKAAMTALTLLDCTEGEARFTRELFQRALEQNEPPALAQLLSSLNSRELALYACIARRQCAFKTSNPLSAGRPVQLALQETLSDFGKLTGAFVAPIRGTQNNASTSDEETRRLAAVLPMLQSLGQLGLVSFWLPPAQQQHHQLQQKQKQQLGLPTSLLTVRALPRLVLTAEHSAREMVSAFSLEGDKLLAWRRISSSTDENGSAGQGVPTLRIPQRVRNAVLTPLEPLMLATMHVASATSTAGDAGDGSTDAASRLAKQLSIHHGIQPQAQIPQFARRPTV